MAAGYQVDEALSGLQEQLIALPAQSRRAQFGYGLVEELYCSFPVQLERLGLAVASAKLEAWRGRWYQHGARTQVEAVVESQHGGRQAQSHKSGTGSAFAVSLEASAKGWPSPSVGNLRRRRAMKETTVVASTRSTVTPPALVSMDGAMFPWLIWDARPACFSPLDLTSTATPFSLLARSSSTVQSSSGSADS